MFWSKAQTPLRSRRFRMALGGVLLIVAVIATPFLLRHALDRMFRRAAERRISAEMDALHFEYLTGQPADFSGLPLPPAALSPQDAAAIRRRLPGFRPLLVCLDAPPEHSLTVVGVEEGRVCEFRLVNGLPVDLRRVEVNRNRDFLRQSFDRLVGEAGGANRVCRLLDASGEVLIRGGAPLLSAPAAAGRGDFDLRRGPDGDFLVLRKRLFNGELLEVGTSLSFRPVLHAAAVAITAGGLSVLLFGALCGWLIGGNWRLGFRRGRAAGGKSAGRDESAAYSEGAIDDLTRTLQETKQNTRYLNEELRTVTDNIAHDLRTPLTRMRGKAEITINGPPDLELYREMACDVAEESNEMLHMINTMLEISRTAAGREQMNFEPVELRTQLQLAYELFMPAADDRRLNFMMSLPSGPVTVWADKLKLQRVVANLLDNAIKFTPDGGRVTLLLRVKSGEALISVADTGIGIEPRDQERVFERFFRADKSRTLPGNGLGLSLVKAIVQAHGGRIDLDSRPGEGSTFTIRLPIGNIAKM